MKELLSILPPGFRKEMDQYDLHEIQEIRLRLDNPGELVTDHGSRWLSHRTSSDDLNFLVNAASRYSPWAASTVAKGFLTAPGGHRIGLCGDAVIQNGAMTGIRTVTSACIRIVHDIQGIAKGIPSGNVIVLGAPGWGKTTLLRDLIRQRAEAGTVAVVDERGEIFPTGFMRGKRTDVLTGCRKSEGISIMIRTMSPKTLAVDEITEEADTKALLDAYGCGVSLLATAHAASLEEFRSRLVYQPLNQHKVFHWALVLHPDKHWQLERMT